MKTKSTILGIALSVFSIGASAQILCPTITGLNVTYVSGSTATVTPVITGTVNPASSSFLWTVSSIGSYYYGGNDVNFPSNGSYTICLSIIDSSLVCPTTSFCTVINVTGVVALPCHASFNMFADSITVGQYYGFNTSTGSGLTYLWNFGDGTTSTLQYPTHTYSPPGSYVVCLTVSSGTTCTSSTCDSSSVHRISSGFVMSHFNVLAAPVGIKELSETISLNTYPNPMGNDLTIEVSTKNEKNVRYILIDALGRNIMQGIIENSKITISTSHLEQGFYNLSITNEKGNTLKTVKLIK